ncbi:MAG: FkbM family methyltransferase [Deltaproteobacteria bacterium]|nr:FkbM family methyltransferase [Deltaproteobacteria bacterium]
MFIEETYFQKRARKKVLKWFKKLENNNNGKFDKNGELLFVQNVFNYYSSKGLEEITFFDIGVNKGEYTDFVLKESLKKNIKCKVYGFEPSKYCFNLLKEKYNGNDNVVLVNKGLSDKNEKVRLHYDVEGSGIASVYKRDLFDKNIEMNESEEIEIIRLEEYLKENKIDRIEFMKIDIEGNEVNAFKGMGEFLAKDKIDFIQFEYGGANIDSRTSLKEIYRNFRAKDFKIAKIMPKGLMLREYVEWMENFQNANYVAISSKVEKSKR